MSTFVDLLPQRSMDEFFEPSAEVEQEQAYRPATAIWGLELFAAEQIRSLVRQVFQPGWPKPARQVVFSPVDESTDITGLCMHVAEVLAEASGTTCVVEADLHSCESTSSEPGKRDETRNQPGSFQDVSRRLSSRLWQVPAKIFQPGNEAFPAASLRGRLAQLRLEFDFTIIQGPAAGAHSEAAMLGHFCDGVVLVLEANLTRRVSAQKVKERLGSANARLLGTVLSERTFPIPEAIYRRL